MAGFLGVIVIAATVWTAGLFGNFERLDGLVYDQFVKWSPAPSAPSQVLLIKAGRERADDGDETWLALVETLRKNKARQIIFLFFPQNVSAGFFDKLSGLPNILFARRLHGGFDGPDSISLEKLPVSAESARLKTSLYPIPHSSDGVFRRQALLVEYEKERTPTLAYTAATNVIDKADLPAEDTFLINFNQGAERIPQVSIERAMKGGLIEELVEGKSVIVGFNSLPSSVGLQTPISTPGEKMSQLYFFGLALDTLLGRSWPVMAGSTVTLVILLALAVLLWVGQYLAPFDMFLWLNILGAAIYTLLGWALIAYAGVFVSPAELLVAHAIIFISATRIKTTEEVGAMRKMIMETASKVREMITTPGFYDSQEHWSKVVVMINQVLDLNKIMLLERVENDHRLREVISFNCSIDDIVEMRRDYERTPYSTAIQENGPIKLTRPYLKDVPDKDDEYLVPLIFGGEVMGFWAFTVDPQSVTDKQMFLATIRDFAAQVSELLYHRDHWRRTRARPALLGLIPGATVDDAPVNELNKTVTLLEGRLDLMTDVLNELDVATILYDLFGDVVQVNQSMEELARSINIAPFDSTALDFVTATTGMDMATAKKHLRNVALHHRDVSIPATITAGRRRNYILKIHPVLHDDESETQGPLDQAAPFRIRGVLLELINVTQVSSAHNLKDRVISKAMSRIHDQIKATYHETKNHRDTSARYPEFTSARQQLDDSISSLIRITSGLGKQGADSEIVDAIEPVLYAINAVETIARTHKVKIIPNLPDGLRLVKSSSEELADVIEDILGLFVNSSVNNGSVEVKVTENDERIVYDFRTRDGGIPNDLLQNYLFSEGVEVSEDYRRMRRAIELVHSWDGTFQAKSQAGEGMLFRMALKKAFVDSILAS